MGLEDEEIPESIASDGFGGLTDDQLADFVTDDLALKAIADWLYNSPNIEPGKWFIDAALQNQAASE
jgi:hypothetical protein